VPPSCPLCGGSDVEGLFTKHEVPYLRCRSCQFVHSSPQTNPNLANDIENYEPAYIQYLEEGPEDRRNYEALLMWMRQACVLEGKRLLDVGCGSGKFVRFLRQQGIEAYGTEPSPALFACYLQSDPFFFPHQVDRLRMEPAVNRFSIITAMDVLEHVERPVEFLESITQLLEEGGTLFLSTPDLGCLTARILGKRWHFFNHYHLSYFTRETLARTAVRFGLKVTGFSHRGRIRSVGYIFRFGLDFLFSGKKVPIPSFLDRLSIPINLFDTMYLAFKKESGNT